MAKTIALQEAASCKQCNRELPVGAQARYYSRDKIFCPDKHLEGEAPQTGSPTPSAPTGPKEYVQALMDYHKGAYEALTRALAAADGK